MMREFTCGKKFLFVGILLLAAGMNLAADEVSLEEIPGLRERAVVVRIVSRIVEHNQAVVWDSENIKVTIPGRPVGIQLMGSNVVVAAQFTPFLRPSGTHILVTHCQIWINIPEEGITHHTTMQTVPLDFGETIYFFPLGSMRANNEARMEIELTLEPYLDRGN